MASGSSQNYSWTAREVQQGFLVLDRNGNGRIDNGSELFGNHTPTPSGRIAPNGYIALAAWDDPTYGGNANGVIDPLDAIFCNLKVWIDSNHDGVSQPSELLTLSELGIVRIEYAYHEGRRRDRFGNLLRYFGRAWVTDGHGNERPISTCDVFFIRVRP